MQFTPATQGYDLWPEIIKIKQQETNAAMLNNSQLNAGKD
jgi:hypothetical protein